jgi:multidrug efflux system membrane fusion protein
VRHRKLLGLISFLVWLLAALGGCQRNPPPAALTGPGGPVAVPVSQPVKRVVTDYVDFTGQTNAVNAVDVRPRVSGYLVQMPFKEGADVKKGEMLFEVDPRPYQAQYDQAVGQVNLYKAQLALAKANYARDIEVAKTPGAVSIQQLDQDKAAVDEADAAVKAYEASLEVYKLNLSFTRVISPIDGQVSRYFLTVGNLVIQDQTLLTTVVSLDPMYVYFDVDEGTLLRARRAINERAIERYQEGHIPVLMALEGEVDPQGRVVYGHPATINFVNNQVNPSTGSLSVRAVFPNPKPPDGTRLFSPGMFARIRLPIGQPHAALLVIDRAIGSDQGLKFVYVVGADGTVARCTVSTGDLQPDGTRAITSGLKGDEWVAVGALQQIRPGAKVKPNRIPMPTESEPQAERSPTFGGSRPRSMPGGAVNPGSSGPGNRPGAARPGGAPSKGRR